MFEMFYSFLKLSTVSLFNKRQRFNLVSQTTSTRLELSSSNAEKNFVGNFVTKTRNQRKSKCNAVFSTPSFIIIPSGIVSVVIVFRY